MQDSPPSKVSIVLASKSPRRKEILERHGFAVDVRVPPEHLRELSLGDPGAETPGAVVIENARLKARSVGSASEWVLASDTIVVLEGREYGKPRDLEQAHRFLRDLAGRTHTVWSSFCLRRPGEEITGSDASAVTFKPLSLPAIDAYLRTVPVLDKAGAYAIQDGGDAVIEKLEGSFYTVMGLPIEKILDVLRDK
jgi:septum formation protein